MEKVREEKSLIYQLVQIHSETKEIESHEVETRDQVEGLLLTPDQIAAVTRTPEEI